MLAPKGKPITVQTFTSVPLSSFAANSTKQGLTQTLANLNFLASAHKVLISFLVVCGFNKVWSINLL